MVENRQVAIVGGGPAGLAAAIEAAHAGAKVLLIDENARPGGQLFKQIHKFFGSKAHNAGIRGVDIGQKLLQQTAEAGVEVWLSSTVIGLHEGNNLAVVRTIGEEKKICTVHAERILICTGGQENAINFEGWTLPGVMGAGCAQTMINVNRVLPGQRVLMIGSGNVGLIVSYQLMQAVRMSSVLWRLRRRSAVTAFTPQRSAAQVCRFIWDIPSFGQKQRTAVKRSPER